MPVSPTAFLTLHRALDSGLINSLEDFYMAARAVLVKSESILISTTRCLPITSRGLNCPMRRTRMSLISGPDAMLR